MNLGSIEKEKARFDKACLTAGIATTLDALLTKINIDAGRVYEANPLLHDMVHDENWAAVLALKYTALVGLWYLGDCAMRDPKSDLFGKKLRMSTIALGMAAYYGYGIAKNIYYLWGV